MIRQTRELNPALWLWAPLTVLVVSIGAKMLDDSGQQGLYTGLIVGEQGIVENITLLVLATGVFFGIRLLLRDLDPAPSRLKYWILLLTLGSIYFLGEEASWGQHLFGWNAPETWQALNQQQETNLHNIDGFGLLFDQGPRNLLTAAALIGGILVPVYRRIRSLEWTPEQFNYWLWPTIVCTPAALFGVFISVPQKVYRALDLPLPDLLVNQAPGELKECFLAFFIMLYLVSLATRVGRAEAPA